MKKIVCPNCRAENKVGRHFCAECGKFLSGEFAPEVYKQSEVKMMRVVENLLNLPHQKIDWDDVADGYARKVEKLQTLFQVEGMGAENNFAVVEKINDFLSLCRNPSFQIAFVGTIKTGKSTLINALLGKNYASMDVTPETAALTKFRASAVDSIKITFYTSDEWERLWASRSQDAEAFMREYEELNAEAQKDKFVNRAPIEKQLANQDIETELAIWSSSKRAEHYFVKEIEVGISTLPKNFPAQVIFVDTPGLSDPVAYRSEITRDYIRKANAVFVCIDAQRIQREEIETIEGVFAASSNNKSKVHIIATHWDALNDPEGDWEKQKPYLINRLTGPAFFETHEMAQENIMHSAAFVYNLCRDYDSLTSRKQTKPIRDFAEWFEYDVPQDLDKIKDKTNVAQIMAVIRDNLARNYKKLLIGDIKYRLNDVVQNLQRVTLEKKTSLQELLAASRSGEQEISARLAEQRKKCDDVKQVSEQLKVTLKEVKYKTERRSEEIIGQLRLRLNKAKK